MKSFDYLQCEDIDSDRDGFLETMLIENLVEAYCKDHNMDYYALTENEYEGLVRELTL